MFLAPAAASLIGGGTAAAGITAATAGGVGASLGLGTAISASALTTGGAITVGGAATAASAGGMFGGLFGGSMMSTLSMMGTAFSGISGFMQQRAAAKGAKIVSRERAAEIRLQIQQEKTQEALDEADREKRLRRALAASRAHFAGAGVEGETGSPKVIQEQLAGQINRESGRAQMVSGLRVSNLNRQASSELRAGSAKASAIRSQAFTGLFQTGSLLNQQITTAGKLA